MRILENEIVRMEESWDLRKSIEVLMESIYYDYTGDEKNGAVSDVKK